MRPDMKAVLLRSHKNGPVLGRRRCCHHVSPMRKGPGNVHRSHSRTPPKAWLGRMDVFWDTFTGTRPPRDCYGLLTDAVARARIIEIMSKTSRRVVFGALLIVTL